MRENMHPQKKDKEQEICAITFLVSNYFIVLGSFPITKFHLSFYEKLGKFSNYKCSSSPDRIQLTFALPTTRII